MIAVGPYGMRDGARDLGKKRMRELRQQQANGVSAPHYQTARHPVHLIIQLLGTPQHALARGLADAPLMAQYFGDGHDRNLEVSRNVHHGYGHAPGSITPFQG